MLSEEQYAEFEKHQDKLLYHMYVIYLRYDNQMKKLQQAANEAMRAMKAKRIECLKRQEDFLQQEKEKEEERERQKQMQRVRDEHVAEVQLTIKRFLTDLMVEDLINPTPVPDEAFTVGQLREVSQVIRRGEGKASESGYTITLEPLEEMDLK